MKLIFEIALGYVLGSLLLELARFAVYQIGRLNEAMHPEIIQAAVAAELKLAAARKKLAAATSAEMDKQSGKGFFSKLKDHFTGGQGGGAGPRHPLRGG